jgi:hypothetical protein
MKMLPFNGAEKKGGAMKGNRILCAAVLAGVLSTPSVDVNAREYKGVTFPDTETIGDATVKLVGIGLRKKLVISVYLGALYLENPTNDAAQVIASDQAKRVVLRFIYNGVGADDLVKAWTEGFEKNVPDKIQSLKPQIDTFKGYFTEGMKTAETIIVTYLPGKGTEVAVKGKVKGVIPGKEFMEALFSVWFGKNPPSGDLKKGMLGG